MHLYCLLKAGDSPSTDTPQSYALVSTGVTAASILQVPADPLQSGSIQTNQLRRYNAHDTKMLTYLI